MSIKIEGMDKLDENCRKQMIEDARREGVTLKFRGDKPEISGTEDSVRKYLKLNSSLQVDTDASISNCDIRSINSDIPELNSELDEVVRIKHK